MTMLSNSERDAIHDWVVATSGLSATSIVWADQRAPQAPAGLYIELRCSDPVPFGQDWDDIEQLVSPAPGAELKHRLRGTRVAVLEIACYPHGAKWRDAQPARRLNEIVSGRNLPLRAQALRAGGIGFGTIGKILDLNLERSTLFEPRSVVEVNLHLTSEVTELGTYIERTEVQNGLTPLGASQALEDRIAFNDLVFVADDATDTLTAIAHGLRTGDGPVRVSTDDTLPAGLVAGTDYWVIRVSANEFRLGASRDLAAAGTPVALTSNGTGNHAIGDRPTTTRVIFEVARED
jgi:hypothetical protein